MKFPPAGCLPDLHEQVGIGGGNEFAITAECQGGDLALVSVQCQQLLAGRRIPHVNPGAFRPDNPFAVWAELNPSPGLSGPALGAKLFSRFRIPEGDNRAVTQDDLTAAVGEG